ncbi:MAG: hypothetical protein IKB02_05330 [Clostridia bacterium]|nr:hypothetical protein [Clostridia bacterium]
MARYIDADIAIYEIDKLQGSLMSSNDALWKKNKMIYKGLCNARGIIDDIPTADAVPKSEVIRCKDCINCDHCYPAKEKGKEAVEGWYCISHKRYVKPEDFCSFAKLKKKYTESLK